MANRNKSELDRARRYHGADDFEDIPPPRDRVRWFGLRLKVSTVMLVGFGNGALMVALVAIRWQFAHLTPWLPVESIRFDIAFLALIIAMSFISFTLFRSATNMFRQDIRDIDERMARRDHATEEEVQEYVRTSEREMGWRMFKRWMVILAVIIPVIPIFGTRLIFPWGGLGSLSVAVFLTMILVCAAIYFSQRISDALRRIVGRSRN